MTSVPGPWSVRSATILELDDSLNIWAVLTSFVSTGRNVDSMSDISLAGKYRLHCSATKRRILTTFRLRYMVSL